MSNTADRKDATLELTTDETQIGIGNTITYFDETHGLQRRLIVSVNDTQVEVVVHVNPNNGERTSFPTAVSERTFEWVDKTAITRINEQSVKISAVVVDKQGTPIKVGDRASFTFTSGRHVAGVITKIASNTYIAIGSSAEDVRVEATLESDEGHIVRADVDQFIKLAN